MTFYLIQHVETYAEGVNPERPLNEQGGGDIDRVGLRQNGDNQWRDQARGKEENGE